MPRGGWGEKKKGDAVVETIYKVGDGGVVAGQIVFVTPDKGEIMPASSNDLGQMGHVVGIATATGKKSSDVAVRISGVGEVVTGSSVVKGETYYLGIGGAIISAPPTTAGNNVQFLGYACNKTTIGFGPDTPIVLA